MRKIALATSNEYSELAKDDRLVLNKLLYWGVDVEPIVWDSKDVAWNQFDAVFIRSCWDYHLRYEEFFKWVGLLESLGVAIFNPPDVLRWNSTKTYLQELAGRSVEVVPTIRQGQERFDLRSILAEQGWERAVVKPVVSANSYETWVTKPDPSDDDQRRAEQMIAAHGQVLVQKFVGEVLEGGEWSFIFFEGVYSHSVLKRPPEGDFRVQENLGGQIFGKKPPRHLSTQAQEIMEKVNVDYLYARVDGVEVDHKLVLMELELIEPSLYLEYHPRAPERFAEAILARLNSLHTQEAEH